MLNRPKIYIIDTSNEVNNVTNGHANFAYEAGFDPVFIFPRRVDSGQLSNYGTYKTIELKFIFKTNNHFVYLMSIFKLFFHVSRVLFFNRNVKYILAVDFTGTIACLAMKIRGCKIYTLVNDNFSARYNFHKVVLTLLRLFEVSCYKALSTACIFPDYSRFKLLGTPNLKNVFFVPNILEYSKFSRWKGSPNDKLIVFLCGWLATTRGVELLPNLVDLTKRNVEFLLMGNCADDVVKKIKNLERVELVSAVPRKKCLEVMAQVDLVFAFYNPIIPININALPQKVYDAVLVASPIYINSEVEMSEALLQTGGCLSSNYFDTVDVAKQLNILADDKSQLCNMSGSLWSSNYREKTIDYKSVKIQAIKMYKNFLK
jgi:hypothetical protein